MKTYGLSHETLAMVSVVQREWAAKNPRATFKAPITVEDDVTVGDAGLGKGRGAGDAEGARGDEILHLADHRRLDALAGAEQVDRLLREVAGALGGDQDQCAAAIGHQAALQQAERISDHPRIQHDHLMIYDAPCSLPGASFAHLPISLTTTETR
jgi:hypothetical protein